MTSNNLSIASSQWFARPDDQRFLSLADLRDAVLARTEVAEEELAPYDKLVIKGEQDTQRLFLAASGGPVDFTHYSFGQLCTQVHAPASYLRTLPTDLVALDLNWGLQHMPEDAREQTKVLFTPPVEDHIPGVARAFTSETYGRIWDVDVVRAVERVNAEERWKVPAASYSAKDPKRATTLYASDHDVFLFLVDPDRPIDIQPKNGDGGDTLFRGFVTWNSEVGDRTFGLLTFLYRYICDNRIIWGAEDVTQLLIRHTKNGPYRFDSEAAPVLKQYAEASAAATVKQIEAAKTQLLASPPFDDFEESLANLLKTKNFTGPAIRATLDYIEEQGHGPTVWDVVNGLTTYAHKLAHTDTRIDVERRASALLDLVEVPA